jgi:hypothetical protein
LLFVQLTIDSKSSIVVISAQLHASRKPVPALEKHWTGSGSKPNGDTFIMPYKYRLSSWLVVRLLPNMQRVTVAQFRSRSDADGHLEIIRRLIPEGEFLVMFNPGLSASQISELR